MRGRRDEGSLEPLPEKEWNRAAAAHLLRRAGFGATVEELDQLGRLGPEGAVERVLGEGRPEPEGSLREEIAPLLSLGSIEQLQSGWIHRMVHAGWPLREKTALFWHDHFATSNAKVQSVDRMSIQNELLRREALGSLRDLLIGISRDPAMIRWLDNDRNWKDHPNENYARELMELFSLGRGHYTERDVQEAARAFTGWHTRGDRFYFDARGHDPGEKEVLGKRGHLGGEDVVDLCLEQPACARFIAGKLAGYFWRPDPPPEAVEAVAEILRGSGFSIATTLRRLFRSRAFYHSSARRALIKSPVVLVVGALRALGGRPWGQEVSNTTAAMGQRLFEPPSVKGWDGGRAWINTATLVARTNFAARLCGLAGQPLASGVDPAALAEEHDATGPEEITDFLLDLLIGESVRPALREEMIRAFSSQGRDRGARLAATLVLASPDYQLA